MAGIRNILGNIPVNPAVCVGISALFGCCGIVPLALHYLTKTLHLPVFLLAFYYILVFVSGLSFLLSAVNLVKEWKRALATVEEVAPPEQELPQFPGAPEP